jgi:small GTP-binding protein
MSTDKKIVLIGDVGVGKSVMLMSMNTNKFEKFCCATYGPMKVDDKLLNLWDIGGKEKWDSIRNEYYKYADGAVIVFDVTHKRSYNNVPKWYNEVQEARPDIPIVIVGNNSDGGNDTDDPWIWLAKMLK